MASPPTRRRLGCSPAALEGTRASEPELDSASLALLVALLREPGLTQSALAERLPIGRSGLTILVADLARRGLVHRGTRAGDRRMRELTLSDEGEWLLQRILASRVQRLGRAYGRALVVPP